VTRVEQVTTGTTQKRSSRVAFASEHSFARFEAVSVVARAGHPCLRRPCTAREYGISFLDGDWLFISGFLLFIATVWPA
jgi:hypothetical protein